MQLSAAGTGEALALHRMGRGLLLQHRRRSGRLQDLRHRTHARTVPAGTCVGELLSTNEREGTLAG
jgi:hypothetical protein